jgi:hypothetical protein|tara:strand:- start:2644 stop:2979 length:336 start_codon:yes stop_codon:yes gene_type:complete
MSKKLIINKRQLGVIKSYVIENVANVRLKNKIYEFLSSDYEPSMGVKKMANEFYNQPLINKKIDGSSITPQALAEYIAHKFAGLKKNEINDCIEGWYYGDYDKEIGMRRKK